MSHLKWGPFQTTLKTPTEDYEERALLRAGGATSMSLTLLPFPLL